MNLNPIRKTIYQEVFCDWELSTPSEREQNIELIDDALMTNNIDTLRALFRRGPLEDGDLPSKTERDWLLQGGYCAKVVVNGVDGFNACTYKGAWLNRCMDSLYRRFSQGEQ